MTVKVPVNPTNVVQLSLPNTIKTKAFFWTAKLTKIWNEAHKDAAASIDEMTARDIYYWVFKSANPVLRPAKGENVLRGMNRDNRCLALPADFLAEKTITFSAAGDLLYSPGMEHSKDLLFERVSDLVFDSTISCANFESPVTNQPLQPEIISDRAAPIECCSPEQFETLKGHRGKNFTILNTANNHIYDMGVEGIATTLKILQDNGIANIGTSLSPGTTLSSVRVIEADGLKIGFVSTTFGLNGRTLPIDRQHLVNVSDLLSKHRPPDLTSIKAQVDDCKAQGCDFIIASIHWGYEFEFFPRAKQVAIAHEIVEYGADTIVGHHPHVVQPVEYYRTTRDRDRVAVIAYSLGSLTWGFSAPHLALSAILNLSLVRGTRNGKATTYIGSGTCTPVFRGYTKQFGKTIARIEKLASHVDNQSKEYGAKFIAAIKRYADLVIPTFG